MDLSMLVAETILPRQLMIVENTMKYFSDLYLRIILQSNHDFKNSRLIWRLVLIIRDFEEYFTFSISKYDDRWKNIETIYSCKSYSKIFIIWSLSIWWLSVKLWFSVCKIYYSNDTWRQRSVLKTITIIENNDSYTISFSMKPKSLMKLK